MPKISVIAPGITAGVDMRQNPLFLGNKRAAFAANLAFKDGNIRTRPGICYHDLGRSGQFQGAAYVTPSLGISAASYSAHAAALVLVAGGAASMHAIGKKGFENAITLEGAVFSGDTFVFGAEKYVIFLNEGGATCWWSGGDRLETSPGIQEASDENTHDSFESKNWLPWNASAGVYVHGRTLISVPFGECGLKLNSELWVSDLLNKRGPDETDDILRMEEACVDAMGGTLVAPSKLGKTVALEVIPTGEANGEGALADFREYGVCVHDTFSGERETQFGGEGKMTQQGWDQRRVTTVKLQTVSAVGRYAVCRLPDDLWFRSDFGFHFLKKTFGTGTIADEHVNHESDEIQPLIDADGEAPLHGAAAGHWLKGGRFLGTAGFVENEKLTSSAMGRGMVVLNQKPGDAEKPVWEGLWLPDKGIAGIHQFTKAGATPRDRRYGFLASDAGAGIFFGEFRGDGKSCDLRGKKAQPIHWKIVTGAFLMSGANVIDEIKGGALELLCDETTQDVKVMIRTDEQMQWTLWEDIATRAKGMSLVSRALGAPPKDWREATWFQFMIEGKGFAELRLFDVEAAKIKEKAAGRNTLLPVNFEKEEYFRQ